MCGAVDIILSGCVFTVSRLIPLSKLVWAVDILVEIAVQSISHKRGFGFWGSFGFGTGLSGYAYAGQDFGFRILSSLFLFLSFLTTATRVAGPAVRSGT